MPRSADPPAAAALQRLKPLTLGVGALAVVAALGVLYLGQVVLLPLATALLLSSLLRPVARIWARWGVPYPLSAVLLVGAVAGLLVGAGFALSSPAQQWIEEVPRSLHQLQIRLLQLSSSFEDVREATEKVEELSEIGDGREPRLLVREQSMSNLLIEQLQEAAVGVFITLIMLFFVIGWGERLYRNLVCAIPAFTSRRKLVGIAHTIERSVSTYLVAITVINLSLGAVVAGALSLLGMPNPLLWGAMTALLNFIPYLGPALTAVVLAFAALASFPSTGEAMLVPAVFLMLTSLEGYLITPAAVGRRMRINPLVILVSIIFWFSMWGIIGALLTVPLLVCIKVTVGHLLGNRVASVID